MGRDRKHDDVVRITTAGTNRAADIGARQRRYLLSMTLRTLCFVGAILASLAGLDWLWPFLIGGALVLPYVAVVMANAVAQNSDGFRLDEIDHQRDALSGPDLTAVSGPTVPPSR
ncbi:DUF3099 domain-containing protein [Nocardioides sp. R-C-SC26]|uniref:DUF3099 domain-containing protein n=1 Tax=Nocardioides sp. R-C-SC26 TaxID=2870414 RepID=UPI001E391DFE|nr:DUF3099 domain-containing protein [Nocardioides sp. R-C-SC26]